MFRRITASWRASRQNLINAEERLSRLVELAEASAQRQAAMDAVMQEQLGHLRLANMLLARVEYQAALSNSRYASPLRLERFGRKTHSQVDEDGIIAEIFRRIGTTSKTFVEIAAGNGKENCTVLLLQQGWSGLWVECSDGNVSAIRSAWPSELADGRLKLADTVISLSNLNDVIASGEFKDGIDLLVMDVDSNEYHLLQAMEAQPRVICVEYYGMYPPPMKWVMPYQDTFLDFDWSRPTGASLQAYEEMLGAKGYALVGTSIAGINAFFVRSDLVDGKFEPPFTAYNHYNPSRYWIRTNAPISAWNGPADGKPPKV